MKRGQAVAVALVALGGEGVALAVASSGQDRWNELAVGAVVAAYAAIGVLILWHRPAQPVGRIAVVMAAAWGVGEALVALGARGLREDVDDRFAAVQQVLGSSVVGAAWLVLVLWLPLVFPDGTAPGTRLRRVARRVVAVTIIGFTLVHLVSPYLTRLEFDSVDNPFGVPHAGAPLAEGLAALTVLLGLVSLLLDVACLTQQYRQGGPLTRQQTLVFGVAFLPPLAGFVATASDSAGPWLYGLCALPLPIAIGVAVLQRRLYDLPLALNRSLTYAALWAAIALLYAVTVGGVGALLRQQGAAWLPWVAAGVVAVSFAPLRDGLQRAANRMTYGQWAQPREVLSRTTRRLADAGEVDPLLQSLVDELAEGLGLGWVEILDASGHAVAGAGVPEGAVDELPLTAYGQPVGVLRWSSRPLREADRQLVADIAAQLGGVVHARGLMDSLRRAQERLVLAREEERRRLRRDLHDGVGPALAGLTLQVDTVRNRLGTATAADLDDLLVGLRSGIRDTVLDVRRIVEGLRPPALDDLGLVEAVHELAERSGMAVTVEAEPLPRLPAAVEVAAYRVVQEALGNAARHAAASRVQVRLSTSGDDLDVEVCDDGCGAASPRPDGLGMRSMRERAEEIGGGFEMRATPGTGTTVRINLPMRGTHA
jgi:signal transduction histidine kinase